MSTARQTTNLVAGTITRYILLAVTIGLGIFLMPFTVRHLGKAQYGLWMLAASITSYFGLLDLGYDSGLVRHIVEADARGDVAAVNRIASTFICVYSVLGLVSAAAMAAIIGLVIPRFPNLTAADIATARWVLAILGLRIAIGFPMTAFGAVTSSRQGFVLNNSVAIVVAVINAAATYLVLETGGGLVALVFWTTAVSCSGYVAYAWTAHHVFPALRLRMVHFSRTVWRDVTSFSLYVFLIDLAAQVTFNVDNVLIGAFLGTSAVAVYAVAVRLSDYQRRSCDQFSGMLFPVAVGIGAADGVEGLRAALVEGTRIAVVLVTGVTICLVGFARPLIVAWMGPAFEGSVVPLYVLAIVGVVLVSHASQQSILLATGSHRLVATVWILEAAANFTCSVALVRPLGAVGVAVGTAIPIVIGHGFVLTPAAARRVGLPLHQYLTSALCPAAIGAPPAIAACVLLRLVVQSTSAEAVIVQSTFAGVLYLAVVLEFGVDETARRAYFAHLRSLRAAFPVRGILAAVSRSL